MNNQSTYKPPFTIRIHDTHIEVRSPDQTFKTPFDATNPYALGELRRTDNVGFDNLVAKHISQCHQILDCAILPDKTKKEMRSVLVELEKHLIACFKIYQKIASEINKTMSTIQAKKTNSKNDVDLLSEIIDLEQSCSNFLIEANQAIKEICKLPAKYFNLSTVDKNFDYLVETFKKTETLKKYSQIINFLEHHKKQIRYIICDLRNLSEHGKESNNGKKLEIENFQFASDGTAIEPRWFPTGSKPISIKEDMHGIIADLLKITETMLMLLTEIGGRVPSMIRYPII